MPEIIPSEATENVDPELDDFLTPEGDQNERLPIDRYAVSSYGADYPVSTLVDRMRRGDLFVPTFQRGSLPLCLDQRLP